MVSNVTLEQNHGILINLRSRAIDKI